MRKIANTSELQRELTSLLDYAGSHQPSRLKLAEALEELSARVAGSKTAALPPTQGRIIDGLRDLAAAAKYLDSELSGVKQRSPESPWLKGQPKGWPELGKMAKQCGTWVDELLKI